MADALLSALSEGPNHSGDISQYEENMRTFCSSMNPLNPDCRTVFFHFLQIFRFIFQLLRTKHWLLCKIHILFYIKDD